MNDTLKQLTETLAQINYAEKKLKGYLKEQAVLHIKKEEAYKKLEKENRDVDKIAGVSFQAFIATLFNNRQEKLEKEELEAIEAKRYYDSVVYEFESVQHEIDHLQAQVKSKSEVEVLYQNAINEKRKRVSPAKSLQHHIHYWVAFYILPLFAFVNAGVDLRNISIEKIASPVSMGIILGLFLGKQIGVFLFSYLAVKYKLAKMPRCSTWMQIYGVSVLTGIGFTMSLFINSLAFEESDVFYHTDKLGILIGSLLSGVIGYMILSFTKSKRHCSI